MSFARLGLGKALDHGRKQAGGGEDDGRDEGDDQQTDEYSVSICVKDGSGPYHFAFRQHLVQLCKENAIDYKLDIYPYYASDASAALSAGAEVKHALFGAGIESSHAYERTHIESVQATEQLVHAYLFSPLV